MEEKNNGSALMSAGAETLNGIELPVRGVPG